MVPRTTKRDVIKTKQRRNSIQNRCLLAGDYALPHITEAMHVLNLTAQETVSYPFVAVKRLIKLGLSW